MYYEKFEELCKRDRITPSDVSKATGVATATLSNWKNGKYTPKQEKLKKIADFFGVGVSYFTGVTDEADSYYLNEETRRIARRAFEDRDVRALFDASEGCRPEDLQLAADMLRRLKGGV